jgi:hypothetical protein
MNKQQINFLKKQFEFIQTQNNNIFNVTPIVTNRHGNTFSIFNVTEESISKLRLLTPSMSYGSFIYIDRIWVSSNNQSYISNDTLKILLNETLTNNLGNKSTFNPFTTCFGNNNLNINQLADKIYGICKIYGIGNRNTLNTIKKYKIRFRCYPINYVNLLKSVNLDKPKILGDVPCKPTYSISVNGQCPKIAGSFSTYGYTFFGIQHVDTHWIWYTYAKDVWEQSGKPWKSGNNGAPLVDYVCGYKCQFPIPQDPG